MDQLAAYGFAVAPLTATSSAGTSGRPSGGAPAPVAPAVVAVLAAAAKPAAPSADLQGVVDGINTYLKSQDREIQFRVDKSTGVTVVKIFDNVSGKLVEQIPSETVMALEHDLNQVSGLLIRAHA